MTDLGVSIVICCYNGAHRLPETIRHIARQIVPPEIPWEFILIDNASTDNSAAITKSIWTEHNNPTTLRVISEPTPGLSHARLKGFESAKYNFIIMCDDDNWLQQDYVAMVFSSMVDKPNVAVLGGMGELVYEVEPPDWIKTMNIFAAGPQAETNGKVKDYKLYGAGCVIRKYAYFNLQKMGFKSLLSDRKGIELSSGGDYELCYAFALAGYDLVYDDRLRFKHFITKERLTWEYFIRYAKESSKCFDVLEAYKFVAVLGVKNFNQMRLKNLYYSLRIYLKINFRLLFAGKNSPQWRILYFKFIEFKYKIKTLVKEARNMHRYHSEVLEFKEKVERERAGE